MQFSIQQWSAWAPELNTAQDWQAWAKKPYLPSSEGAPDVPEIPAMQRRRMNRLSKMAYFVTNAIHGSKDVPQIFCSRHGDLSRSVQLLQQIACDEPLSSTNFALSVHNAVGGGTSILQGNKNPITSIASGEQRMAMAFVEATTQLLEYKQVLIVIYDDIMPSVYQNTDHQPYALAFLISRGDEYRFNWQASTASNKQSSNTLPFDLQFLSFVLNQSKKISLTTNHTEWQWHKQS